jgi:hypothetical protein
MLKTIQVCEYVCRPETVKTVKNNTFTVPYASLNRKFLKTDNSEFIGEKVISIWPKCSFTIPGKVIPFKWHPSYQVRLQIHWDKTKNTT